jgi:hypothetical protein
MLENGDPMKLEEFALEYSRHEVEYNIKRLMNLGLLFVNDNGEYELVEEKKLYILLSHFIGIERKTILRYSFYLGFIITSLIIFLYYVNYIPIEQFTLIVISGSFLIFSSIVYIFEMINVFRFKSYIQNIFDARKSEKKDILN